MVHHLVEDWSEHVGKNVLTYEIDTIFDYDQGIVDILVHEESYDIVIVVQIRISKVEFAPVYDRVKIAFAGELEVSLKI